MARRRARDERRLDRARGRRARPPLDARSRAPSRRSATRAAGRVLALAGRDPSLAVSTNAVAVALRCGLLAVAHRQPFRRPADPAGASGRPVARPGAGAGPALVGGPVPLAALAAGLRDQPDRPDLDAPLDALDHVVDRERGDRRRRQRLHLDAGRAGRRGLGPDPQPAGGAIRA